jgi:hypothetical protein
MEDADDDPMPRPAEYDDAGEPTCTMFQTSREHYGVFYRLDLIAGQPELRVIVPADRGPIRMAGFRVRPAPGSDIPSWFGRLHDAEMVGDSNAAFNHVLFACGEILKNLFWAGNHDTMRFPDGITVTRLFD